MNHGHPSFQEEGLCRTFNGVRALIAMPRRDSYAGCPPSFPSPHPHHHIIFAYNKNKKRNKEKEGPGRSY